MGKRDGLDERRGRDRYPWLVAFVVVFFGILAIRLLTLQFFEYDYYAQYAQENQLQRERIMAPRGLIRDRAGVVLVDNVPSFDIVLPWRSRQTVIDHVRALCAYLPLDSANVFARFEIWQKKNAGIPFPIVPDADKIFISFVRENYDLFPQLRVETNARRRYPNGPFAAHLLGYVGEVSDEFLTKPEGRSYYSGDLMGKTGIEALCEGSLNGEDGQRVVAVNAAGTVLGELKELLKPPVPGHDVILTIDARLQHRIEELIAEWGAGAAAVMNVEDGSLLAVVSLPQFDPNSFAMGINQKEWEKLYNAPDKPLFNRFLQATYPPGSTLKIVSAYTVLHHRLFAPSETLVYCTGAHRFGNRTFRCWKAWGHGYMDLYGGVVQSCDSYFYKVAEVLDVDDLAGAARDFGLGSRTGIELPNEVQGLVPDREYYNRRHGKGKWTQGLVLNNIIGQGEFLVGVLQMCRLTAAVANGGYLVEPHVIREVEGEVKGVYEREKITHLGGQTLRFIQRAMKGVVWDEEGTGRASRVDGITSAGKTGTSQNPHGEDHAWFVGYAPAEAPEIAFAVLVENAGHGGAVAAPICRELIKTYFTPDEPESVLSLGPPDEDDEAGESQ